MRRRETSHHTGIAKAAITAALTGAMTLSGAGVAALAVGDGAGQQMDSQDSVSGTALLYRGDNQIASYGTLKEAVDNAVDGDKIVLAEDCTGSGIVFPQGKFRDQGLVIDFAGCTYTVDGAPVGSTGTETLGFQLLKDNKITLKDGTLKGNSRTNPNLMRMIQNYSDLTLDSMIVSMTGAYYNQITMSSANGNTVLTNGAQVNAPDYSWANYNSQEAANMLGAQALSVGPFSTYPSASVTVDNGSIVNGNVEISNESTVSGSTANLNIGETGTIQGALVLDDDNAGGVNVTKDDDVELTAPAGYQWQDNSDGTKTLVDATTDAESIQNTDNAGLLIKGDSGTQYNLYRIFKADVTAADPDNTNAYTAENIEWTSNAAIKNAVIAFLKNDSECSDFDGFTDSSKKDANAQKAAEYIAGKIAAGGGTTTGSNDPVDLTNGDSFANRLARAIESASGVQATKTLTEGTAIILNESGYYLAVADATTVPNSATGTAPIWIPYTAPKGRIYEVTPKSGATSFSKTVSEDGESGESGKLVDAGNGEVVTFTLTSKLPDNYAAYASYDLVFTDTLPTGLTYVGNPTTSAGSLAVTDGENGAKVFTVTNLNGVSAGDAVVVTYQARVNTSAGIGVNGANRNNATLSYPNDPNSDGRGTLSDSADVLTYQLNVKKIDKGTQVSMPNIGFTVKQGDLFVQSDGTLGTSEVVFTTNETGNFSIPRIDDGTYTIIEKQDTVPAGYTAVAFDVTINSTLTGTPSLTVNSTDANVEEATADTASGIVSIKVSNTKEIVLPITGMTPSQLASKLGIVLIVAGGALMLVYVSKNKKKSEDK